MIWRTRDRRWEFPRPAVIVGVLNLTPDSFSDGIPALDSTAAIEKGLSLIAEGADILDLGGESTRPGAAPVPAAEECRRVLPVLEALVAHGAVPISIDTMKPEVARLALRAGARIVNDVAANRPDPAMWRVVAEFDAGYVLTHMQGVPAEMNRAPHYADVVREVGEFFTERLEQLRANGVSAEQVVLDVGIGFGKTPAHNLALLAAQNQFQQWKRPLLLGASRKSFIGAITAEPAPHRRLAGSLACACWAVAAGVHLVRAHDVAATRQAVRMIEAIQSART